MTESRAWRQLAASVPNADTPAQMAALRAALVMMLNDEDYPELQKERDRVTTALSHAGWTEETRKAMTVLALRWAQGKTFVESLRQAMQSTGEEREAPRPTAQPKRNQPMATITPIHAPDNEAGVMAENLISDLDLLNELHRQADKMRIETDEGKFPFAAPPEKLVKALKYAETGHVTLREYDATVKGSKKEPYTVTTFGCTCEHGKRSQSRWGCHHTVAVELVQRAKTALAEASGQAQLFAGPKTVDERLAETPQDGPGGTITMENDGWSEEAPERLLEAPRGAVVPEVQPRPRKRPTIAAEHIQLIKGKRHVKFIGLVLAAHEDGLQSLSAEWILNETDLSLAHATAIFADGRRYEECGDATPSNVTPMVQPHFRRVALTRAKARCLRDALGIAEAALEELGEEGEPASVPDMTRTRPTPPPPSPRDEIKALLAQLGYAEPTPKLVRELTGQELAPQHYAVILSKLKALVVTRN